MEVSSGAFKDGGKIPSRFTCDGEDVSPPLKIKGVSTKTKSLALVMDDPDAPIGVFDHWLIWNIPADTTSIPEGVPREKSVGSVGGARQGRNGFGGIGYRGPCPPGGPAHRYRFKLYALDTMLDLGPGASKAELERAMEGHIVEKAELTGRYGR